MKLLVTIIDDELTYDLMQELSQQKIRSTKLSSTGGFLKKGNTTLLIGVPNEDEKKAMDIIRKISEAKGRSQNSERANANIFVIHLEDYKRF